jgi:hypothetical protein
MGELLLVIDPAGRGEQQEPVANLCRQCTIFSPSRSRFRTLCGLALRIKMKTL